MNQVQTQRPQFAVTPGSLETFAGTFAESGISQGSFGLFNPDIIPEEQEQEHPWATTAGRVAGNIAGFIGSLSAIKSIGGLALTAFGTKIIQAGKFINTGKTLGYVGLGMKYGMRTEFGMGAALVGGGTTFAIHDVAEEFIRQMKDNDLEAYELGKKLASGFLQGGIYSYGAKAFSIQPPLIQMGASATTMATAEAINAFADGNDFGPVEFAQAALMGGVMGLMGSVGWKERRAGRNATIGDVEKAKKELIEFGPNKEWMSKYLDYDYKELPSVITKSIDLLKGAKGVAKQKKWPIKAGVKDQPYAFETLEKAKEAGRQSTTYRVRGKSSTIKGMANSIGLSDKEFEKMLFERYGATSQKKITVQQASDIRDELISMADDVIIKAKDKLQMDLFGYKLDKPITGFKGVDELTRSADEAILRNHPIKVMLTDITGGRELKVIETNRMEKVLISLMDDWHMESKTTLRQKVGSIIKNRPTKQEQNLWQLIQLADDNPAVISLTPKQKQVRRAFKDVAGFYYERENQFYKLFHGKDLGKRDFYIHHQLNPLWLKKNAGKYGLHYEPETHELFALTAKQGLGKKSFNPTELKRMTYNLPDEAYIRDPVKNTMSMIRSDLKSIYLDSPNKVLQQKVRLLQANGLITNKAKEDLTKWVNIFFYGRQGEYTEKFNKGLQDFLHKAPYDFIEKAMNHVGRSIDHRPLDGIVNMFGQGVHYGMIAGRPVLAMRNLLQSSYAHGYTSTKNMAKAMGKMPDNLKKIIENDSWFRSTVGVPEEGMVSTGNYTLDMLNYLYPWSHHQNVHFTAKAAYFQAQDYRTLDKYRVSGKGWKGRNYAGKWYDDIGESMRKEAKQKGLKNWRDIMSPGEQELATNWVKHVVSHTQFVYDALGLPAGTRNPAFRGAFKLMSYPMNYTHKYLGDMRGMWRNKGKLPFDPKGAAIVPAIHRYGLIKHVIGVGAMIAAFDRIGLDYSQMGGFVPYKNKKDQWRVKTGVFETRPSPGVQLFLSLINMFNEDPYKSSIAKRNAKDLLTMHPGRLAIRDIQKVKEKGSRLPLIVRQKYVPKSKSKKKELFPSPYKSMPKIQFGSQPRF